MKSLVSAAISAARNISLKVRASTSDMGACNKALWASVGVSVTRSVRKTSYVIGESNAEIHAIADVPHLIKNMRNAFLSHIIILPTTVFIEHDLPSTHVSSGYLKQLWIDELNSDSALRSLHHLGKLHLFSTHFSVMNVATAVQLFSVKTAAALEKAVRLKQIDKNALSAAWWIRLMAQWFEIMTARHKKQGITQRNKEQKFKFLHYFIDIIQETQFDRGWKPLQTGMILSTLSVLKLTDELFSEGFTYFLSGRLTQDSLENVFGQIRRKSASKPTALKAKEALRLICISQFISDKKFTNYAIDSDYHLLDTSSALSKSNCPPIQAELNDLPSTSNASDLLCTSNTSDLPDTNKDNNKSQESAIESSLSIAAQENDIYFIAGAVLNILCKRKSICQTCLLAIKEAKDSSEPDIPKHRTLLTEYSDRGGLKRSESGLYRLCREAERSFRKNKDSLILQQ